MALLRGAVPSPRHRLAAAEPHKAVGVVPPQFLIAPKQLSMWGNDVNGDCVTAEEAFAKSCYTPSPEIFISEAEAIQWARTNGFLNGATLVSVLDRMEISGFSQNKLTYDDGTASSVDWTNPTTLHSAIYHGPVKIGIAADQVQSVCESFPKFPSNGWIATGFNSDRNEDHCTSLCGYGTIGWLASQLKTSVPLHVNASAVAYAMFTWSSIGIIDQASMIAITHEAWLRNPTTIIK
jgi:hypothetical protein